MARTPKAQATASRIGEAAATLFLERGFEATTIAEVAAAAGVASGTVLLHFGSKSELATAAFALNISGAVSDAVASLPDASARLQVSHIVEHLYRWYRTHGDLATVLLRESLFSTGVTADQYSGAVADTVRAFQQICAAELPESDRFRDAQARATHTAHLGEGLLADYLLVLVQGLRGRFETVESQVEHFNRLAALRWDQLEP